MHKSYVLDETSNIDIEHKTVWTLYVQILHYRGIIVIYLNPEVET